MVYRIINFSIVYTPFRIECYGELSLMDSLAVIRSKHKVSQLLSQKSSNHAKQNIIFDIFPINLLEIFIKKTDIHSSEDNDIFY